MALITAAELAEAKALVDALPDGEWTPAGNASRPYGWNYHFSGGIWRVGGDGSVQPEVARFILMAHSLMPRLILEYQRLDAEVARLKDENKQLRAAKRAAAQTVKGN